ncbi:MAG TPA: hypothetical protein VNF73_02285, partial [Candidatus Saccharimonadales bacterium]|nr:hypothetical protein [Candidatus Saccharimonadales bacterium]
GGSVARGRLDTAPTEPEPTRVAFRPARVGRLLGDTVDPSEQQALLAWVAIETEPAPSGTPIVVSAAPTPLVVPAPDDDVLVAIVPTWRRDLAIEADVTEEIARIRGYETTPGTLTHTEMPPYRPSPLEARDRIRHVLAGAGLFEVVTHALVPPGRDDRLGWPIETESGAAGETDAAGTTIRIVNPLSSQHSVLRRELVGSLLDVMATNLRQGREDVAIFEVGKGYGLVDGAPREWWRVAIALSGAAEPRAWNRPLRPYDLDDLKGIVELLAGELASDRPTYEPTASGSPLHPGRAAVVTADRPGKRGAEPGRERSPGGRVIAGTIGEVHPDVLAAWEIRAERVLAAELSIAGLTSGRLPVARVAPIDRFPAVERDLAVVVSTGVPAASVERRIQDRAGELLQDVRLFDVYPMPGDERSLAYRLTFQAGDRTLTESEIDDAMHAVVRGLGELGGRIRA